MSQLTQTVARNSAFELAGQLTIKALSFGFSILIVRNLGPQEFGKYAAVLAFGMIFAVFSDLGLGAYAVREIARLRDAENGVARIGALWGDVVRLRIVLAFGTALLITAVAVMTNRPPELVIAIALSTLGLFGYAVGASSTVLSGFERFDLTARGSVANQIVFVLFGALALYLGLGYFGLIVANLLGVGALAFLYVRGARSLGVSFGRGNPRGWLALLRASIPFGVIGLALGLSYKFDSFLLNLTRGDLETGYYNAAYNLVFSAVMFSNVLNTALYPSLTRAAANDSQHLPPIYERALRYLLLVSLPIAVGVSALAHQIVPLLFKVVYAPAIPALQVVIWVVPLMYASEFLGYVVIINGDEYAAMRSVLISTVLNVMLNLVLIPTLGFIAAAVMTVVTEFVLVGQYLWLLRRQIRQMNWRPALRAAFAVMAMGAIALLLRDVSLFIVAPVGALVYGGLLLVLGVVGGDEWNFIMNFRRRTESQVIE